MTVRLMLRALTLVLLLSLAACASQPKPGAGDSPAELNAKLGLSYLQQGNFDVALEKLNRALEQDPNLPEAHHYIAELYKTLRNHELAERHYLRAIRLSPDDGALQNNFGVFLCEQERFADAEARFIRAAGIAGYQRPDDAYMNAAQCALREPDKTKAKGYFRRALDLNPMLTPALYQMAVLSFETGEYLQSRAFLQRYAAIARHNPQTLWLGVRIEHELDNRPAREDYARQLRREFPRAEETSRLREFE